MEIYTFDKSLQQRLADYQDIFYAQDRSILHNTMPASQIWPEWGFYLELNIEPVGWRALWKISRRTCQELEIHYPTIVLVEVEHVDYDDLSALVKIVAVQDEVSLPEKYDVLLIDLYPTKQQEHDLDLVTTANCIEQLRFFYNHLWMPWDDDSDENTDWVNAHLETRIRLFFDMKKGEIPKKTCEVVRSLIREGRDIKDKISKIESDITDDDEDQKAPLDQEKTCQLMKFHFRLQQIKTEMEVLENPTMRQILIQNYETQSNVEVKKRSQVECFFVWLGGSLDETISSLNNARNFLQPDAFIRTTNSLQEALDSSQTGDFVILGNGNFEIRSAGGLEEGGTIKGIGAKEQTIIEPTEINCGPSLFDFNGDINIENVSIDLGELIVGIIVRQGCVKISNSKISSSKQSVVKLGVIVLPGAKFVAENVTFSSLGSAVVVYKEGETLLSHCSFEECVEGVHVHDNSQLVATSCNFSGFKESAIRLETEKYGNSQNGISGGLEILENVSETKIQDCNFKNNVKGDVTIKACTTSLFANKQEPMSF